MKTTILFVLVSILAACDESIAPNVPDGVCIDADEFGLIWRPCDTYRPDGSCEYLFLDGRFVAPRSMLATREACLGDDYRGE
jgi:hypothetical protein